MLNLKNLFGKKEDSGPQVQLAPGQHAPGIAGAVAKLFDKNEKEVQKLKPTVERIAAMGPELKALSDEELKQRSRELKAKFQEMVTERLQKQRDAEGNAYEWLDLSTEFDWNDDYHKVRRAAEKEVLDEILPEAFALTREAGDRTIGLRHYDVQMIGGSVLHSGRIGEMRTGEGKTLVATLPAYLNAITGRGVHVITVNDYLAERDANWMRPIYEFLGLSVAFLTNDMSPEQRKPAYECDILYATNSEVGFDYLRDNMARSADDVVQRPLNYAIIDEVDNILIDEARTPLIISAQVAKTDRALRRQQMAKTCDGLARKLVPAVTDREIELLQDSFTEKGRINIEGLMGEINKNGAFTQAIEYLVDAYLVAEKSARVENAAHLLDVAQELSEQGLLSAQGRTQLENIALNAVHPAGLRNAWSKEIARLTEQFATAYTNAVILGPSAAQLAHDLVLPEDYLADLEARLNENENDAASSVFLAQLVAEEMARRALVEENAIELVTAAISAIPVPENLVESEKARRDFAGDVHAALQEVALHAPGALADADAILADAVGDEASTQTVEGARRVVDALENMALRGLLPFETGEKLWEAVRLSQGQTNLRREIAETLHDYPGENAERIATLVDEYSQERKSWLETEAEALKAKLPGHEELANRAKSGESASELRRSLGNELAKSGPFAEITKEARRFGMEQFKAHQQIAAALVEEMSQWVEVPQGASRVLVDVMAEGGKVSEINERIMLAVRDYPGENTELPALVGDAVRQLAEWRQKAAVELSGFISQRIQLPEESLQAIRTAIEDGTYSNGIDNLVGEQLLLSPEVASQSEAVDSWGERWDEFRANQNETLENKILDVLALSTDAQETISELLNKPSSTHLTRAVFDLIADDAVSRHLEPLLTEENAPAFAEEVQRRVPLAKEIQKRVKPADFTGRSSEQLKRAINRLVQTSFQVMPIEDFKRVIRNLGWFTEKDEKRRQAALTDMGTLIAEREVGTSAFTDPDGFLETLVSTEILTDEEAAVVRRAQTETPDESLTTVIDRVLRLPADRRRRLAEAKLQEVQSVLDQAVKAHALFKREVNYVIDTNPETRKPEIVIVDEFTGRKMPGRRYSEGLHEAIEAKHGLEVQLESQTVATITIQNYFRLYDKISGMTGTAKTEEQEFAKTYGIEVVSIPTNRQIQRRDWPDVVYKTEEAKFRAITFEILEHHCTGQPVLVGTRSVDVSEKMSERLKAQSLQSLVLAHLIKNKLWSDNSIPEDQKQQIQEALRTPVAKINPMQIKAVAKQVGLQPEAAHDDNVNALISMFTVPNPSRERLATALRVGLPHNVLNAKNHRNEARIIAEAARPAAVTIATNMAGRGVDIVLGGTLDVESRWRVMTLQSVARYLEGKEVQVRSRNESTTQKFVERLSPDALQSLGWILAQQKTLAELEQNKAVEGQTAKELRDTLGQEVTTQDLKNKVKSRARRLNLLEQLPLEATNLSDEVIAAVNGELHRLMGQSYNPKDIERVLESGIAAQASGRDPGEAALLEAISRPLGFARRGTEALLTALLDAENLDAKLLDAASRQSELSPLSEEALAEAVGNVTLDWVGQRLRIYNVRSARDASEVLPKVSPNEVELSEVQLMQAMGEAALGTQWLRERLKDWGLVKEARAYQVPDEVAEQIGDNAVVHFTIDRALARRLNDEWEKHPAHARSMVTMEAPNLILMGDLAEIAGQTAPFLHPEWMHQTLADLRIIDQEDVFQAQMMGQAEDENGNVQPMPIDVLVYRLRLNRVLNALDSVVREAVAKVGDKPADVLQEVVRNAPWAETFVDEEWARERMLHIGKVAKVENAGVFIETGVAGQSADIVLESEPRPEDIAHTSEQEEVKELGGLHIIGTERHESRRIDNQLRGRAGRQGDPGSSRFYVSLEDELWRLFGVRGQWLLNKWDEDEAVEAGMISKSIERAQKKVELNHFEGRKNVLQYDDVMNVQREVIYRERRRALLGADLHDTVLDMAKRSAITEAEKHCPRDVRPEEWDTHKLYVGLGRIFGTSLLGRVLKQEDMHDMHWIEPRRDEFDLDVNGKTLGEIVDELYVEREEQLGADQTRDLERYFVTRNIDEYWMEHLAEMDYLRDAIWQEGYAQKDPIGVYRQEGFKMFQKMLEEIRRTVTENLFSYGNEISGFGAGGPQIMAMQEARMLTELPYDEDSFTDGVMLDKDADGDDDVEYVHSPVGPTEVAELDDEGDVYPDGSSNGGANARQNTKQGKNSKRKKRH